MHLRQCEMHAEGDAGLQAHRQASQRVHRGCMVRRLHVHGVGGLRGVRRGVVRDRQVVGAGGLGPGEELHCRCGCGLRGVGRVAGVRGRVLRRRQAGRVLRRRQGRVAVCGMRAGVVARGKAQGVRGVAGQPSHAGQRLRQAQAQAQARACRRHGACTHGHAHAAARGRHACGQPGRQALRVSGRRRAHRRQRRHVLQVRGRPARCGGCLARGAVRRGSCGRWVGLSLREGLQLCLRGQRRPGGGCRGCSRGGCGGGVGSDRVRHQALLIEGHKRAQRSRQVVQRLRAGRQARQRQQ